MRSFIAAIAAVAVNAFKYESFLSKTMNGEFTPVTITVDGQEQTKYVASKSCTSSESTYTCREGARGYILNEPQLDLDSPNYFSPNLLGSSIEWDIDLSDFGCGCFNTFYTVSMPGKTSDGSLDQSDGYFYCDANAVGGVLCPEIDFMEANKYAFQTTAHSCGPPSDKGHYTECDGSSPAHKNSVVELDSNGYGPGDQYTIDTTKEFHVKISLAEADGSFSGILT